MARAFVTRCPGCNTRFQVSTDQLHAAGGLVRCGGCQQVFDAHAHLESAPSRSPKPPPRIPREPLQLHGFASGPRRGPTLIWSLLCLAALTGMAAQALWFERQQLARSPLLAPLYEQACRHLPCALQARRDLLNIHSEGLLVRDHPAYRDALEVRLLMENRAAFEQPFPALELVFSALDGTPRAARVFQPGEYLAGDLGEQTLMPVRQPIQVRLELLEPGTATPNYQLRFVTAQHPVKP